jgi:transposase
MGAQQKVSLRNLTKREEETLRERARASSERVDVARRAQALLAVAQGCSFTTAGKRSGMSRQGVSQLVERFNQRGVAVLLIAAGRGRKATYTSEHHQCILQEVQRSPNRRTDQTATWSLSLLKKSLRAKGLPHVSAETIRVVLHAYGWSYQRTRTWCRTGTAQRKRKSGTVIVTDPETVGKTRRIEQAYEQAGAAGIMLLNEDEAGPYQALPQPGASWEPEGQPQRQPHEYIRGGTAKLLTLFHPATGEVRAKGVTSVPNVVLHPWLKEQLSTLLAQIEQHTPQTSLPPEEQRPLAAQWQTWLGHLPNRSLPPLRIVLVLDNLAGHRSQEWVEWCFDHGIMLLFTPLGGSWLNMAESIQRIIVRRALAGQHPQNAQEVIDWLEQTVTGWNADPTPFIWNGKRRRRRERARLRRLGGSGAALFKAS